MELQISNPILSAEFRHQRYIIMNSRSGAIWIALAVILIAPALIIALAYTVALLFNLIPRQEFYNLPNTVHINLGLLLLVANLSLYPVVTLVAIALGRNSISREKEKHTWGLLRLTDIDSRTIILGKWWASLRGLWGDHLMVIILRVGLLAWYLVILLPAQHGLDDITAPYRLYFLFTLPFVLGQATLDAAFSAILGLVSALPDEVLGSVISTSAMVLRLFLSVAVGFWTYYLLAWMRSDFLNALYLASGGFLLTAFLLIITLLAAQKLTEWL